MKVLNNLKKIRWEKNISQNTLAKLSGVDKGTISRVENGLEIPSQITILKLSRGLKMEANEIFHLDWRKHNV